MSSTNSAQLTEEQEKLLSSLEEEFKDRYTENDEEFKAALKERLPLPPVIENWGDHKQRDERRDNYRHRHSHNNEYEYDRYRNVGRYNPYFHESGDRYPQSSREDYRYSRSSREDYRYSHSSREDYRYSHSPSENYRYTQRNHYADRYKP